MTIRRSLLAPVGCALLGVAACGGGEEEQAPPPPPVIIESARTDVVVGADTVMVFTPTVFAYFVASPSAGGSPTGLMQLVQEFQGGIQAAERPLREMGVQIQATSELPRVLGLTPEQEAAAGPPLEGSSYGYVFVDARRHVRRVTSRMAAADMVCVAARTFGLTPNPQLGATCG